MERKDVLISIISKASSKYGDLLLDFMELNNLDNLREATEEQLEQYISDYQLEE